MAASNFESGLRPMRVEYIAETTTGQTPANPTMLLFSDKVSEFNQQSEVDIFDLVGLSDVDPADFLPGPETHSFPISYYLQGALSARAVNDGLTRNADNQLPNSHSILARMDRSTGGIGADAGGIRLYYHGVGCWTRQVELALQTSTGEPVAVTQDYASEKGRIYRIDQPSSATLIGINSTDAADTSQTCRIESDGEPATTDQSAALNGTTYVSMGASTYGSIDSISLDLETKGDLEVSINTGSDVSPVKGTVLCTIRGSDYYGAAEGDLGIPALGTGARGVALGSAYESFRAATLERPAATSIAFAVANGTLRVNNNLDIIPVLGLRQEIQPGRRTTELVATVFGIAESHAKVEEHLGAVDTDNIVLTLPSSTATLTAAVLASPGSVGITGGATIQLGVTYRSKGLTVT